jgi:acyl-CoA thioester hydrolase
MNWADLKPTLNALPCVCRRRVLYGEVDKMNLVYGSHYLTWFEHGRNESLRQCGLPYTEVEKRGLFLPAVESRVWHIAPLHYDDLVEIRCAVTDCTHATATFTFALVCDGVLAAAGTTRHACLGPEGRPIRLPDWLRSALLRDAPGENDRSELDLPPSSG